MPNCFFPNGIEFRNVSLFSFAVMFCREGFHRVRASMWTLKLKAVQMFKSIGWYPLSQPGVIKCLPTSLLFCVEMSQTFIASPGSWFFSPWLPFKLTTVVSLWCYDFQIYRTSNIFISEMTPHLLNPGSRLHQEILGQRKGRSRGGLGQGMVPLIQEDVFVVYLY